MPRADVGDGMAERFCWHARAPVRRRLRALPFGARTCVLQVVVCAHAAQSRSDPSYVLCAGHFLFLAVHVSGEGGCLSARAPPPLLRAVAAAAPLFPVVCPFGCSAYDPSPGAKQVHLTCVV